MGYKFEKYSIGGGGSGVGEYINMECYWRHGTNASDYYTMEALLSSGGFTPVITYHVVAALPENPNVTDLTTGNPMHIYFYNDVPYLYGNAGYGNMWLGLTDLMASFDIITTAKGFTYCIEGETEEGVYVTYNQISQEGIDRLNSEIDGLYTQLRTTSRTVVDIVAGTIQNIDLSKCEPVYSVGGFLGAGLLNTVTLSPDTHSIRDRAFQSCHNLKTITGTESLMYIGQYAFSGCEKLTNIVIPEGVGLIERDTFYGCRSLTSITIPDSVTSIGDEAFRSCRGLTSITLGNSVTSIGDSAFLGCTNLTSINIPDGVTSIGEKVFEGCSGLTSINIPDGVTSIKYYTFYGCRSLTSITIPDSVTSIGDSAFHGCTNLTSINIPDGVTSIGRSAFAGCTSLTSITVPDSVTKLSEPFMFSGCTSLTSITIPNSVTTIGIQTFAGSTSLASIIYTGTKAQWKAITTWNNWDEDLPDYIITCTDGTIAKDGTET